MKRRDFLLLSTLSLAGPLCGRLISLAPTPPGIPRAPSTSTPSPTAPPPPTTFSGGQARLAAPSTTPPPAPSPTTAPSPTLPAAGDFVANDLVDDDFSAATLPSRVIRADSAGQVSISDGVLRIQGIAPADHDPAVSASPLIPRAAGQAVGARFEVAPWQASGKLGLVSPTGEGFACLSRTTAEGEGGTITCGQAAYPLLNLYSGCWYDFVLFLQPGRTAVAVNDGAGLELVLLNEDGGTDSGLLTYDAASGLHQDASIDSWYAIRLESAAAGPYFPPALVSEPKPNLAYEADLGDNAAWVEARLAQVDGQVGLRVRSLDPQNEYRIYLDGAGLHLDQVISGQVEPLAHRPVVYREGAKLAVRYNELTLTVYYDDQLCGITNRKIGAADLLEGTKIGIHSTHPANTVNDLSARPVRLAVPAAFSSGQERPAVHAAFSGAQARLAVPENLTARLLNSRRVLCLGDSLTSADKAYGYQNRLRKRLGPAWVTLDAGVIGQTSAQILARLPGHLRRGRPEVVILLAGVNDIERSHAPAAIQANLQASYQAARQAGCRVIAVTLPPRAADSPGWNAAKQAALSAVNGWILENESQFDALVDLTPQLADPATGSLLPRYNGGDGLHLSPDGYNLLGDLIYASLPW